MEETKLIKVKLSTKDKLDKLGSKGESYDDIIVRLLNKKRSVKK